MDNNKPKNTICFRLHGSSKAMFYFVVLYLELLKCRFHTEYSVTNLDSPEETRKYHHDRENGVLLKEAIDIQNKYYNAAINNPTAIISGSKYTTGILVNQLKRDIDAKYISLDDLKVEQLQSFKYVVFIVDSITRKRIEDILNNNDVSINVILVTEEAIRRKGLKKKIKKQDNVISEVFFRSAFKFCGCLYVFNKKEPSEGSIAMIRDEIRSVCFKI